MHIRLIYGDFHNVTYKTTLRFCPVLLLFPASSGTHTLLLRNSRTFLPKVSVLHRLLVYPATYK